MPFHQREVQSGRYRKDQGYIYDREFKKYVFNCISENRSNESYIEDEYLSRFHLSDEIMAFLGKLVLK